MDGIRVTYSGLVSFAINLISIITGLVFVIIVTRNLSAEEFGTWGLINGIIIYSAVINPIISYWITREVARGERPAKTSIVASSLITIPAIIIYLAVGFFTATQSDANLNIILFAVILVPVMIFNETLTAINLGQKPQVTSYGILTFELVKIPSVLFFIYFFKFGVEGAILASCVAYLASISIQAFYAQEQLRSHFKKEYLVKWLRLFWLPTYRHLPALLHLSDVVIFSIITGSVIGVAYYSAARSIGMLVNNVRAFSKGLYPKLLETQKQEFLEENLIKLFYFAFPLTAFSIIFAKPGMFALNPIYLEAAPFVIFISIRMFLNTLNRMLFEAILGMETIDKNPRSTFRDYIKSKLFWYPTLDLIRHGVYIGVLAFLLFVLSPKTESTLDLVFYWVLIYLAVEIPLSVYIIRLVKKSFTLKIDKKSMIKYLLASIVIFGLVWMLMEQNLEYKNSIFEFFPALLMFGIIGVVGYLGTTYLIDRRTKLLFKAIWNELLIKEK
ncbi:MAG TPA: hypothetical protein VD731_04745 [Nitrosopumilaceae archaeon]|nr:hypothetical protein [Nitrosopumilaceae archaeon]